MQEAVELPFRRNKKIKQKINRSRTLAHRVAAKRWWQPSQDYVEITL